MVRNASSATHQSTRHQVLAGLSSDAMTRTTLNIDDPILQDLKRLQKEEKKSLGRLVSDLLAWAIRTRETKKVERPPFTWNSRSMDARVDLADKDAVWSILDRDDQAPSRT